MLFNHYVSLSDVHIQFQSDNTCAISYIQNFGGIHSLAMDKLAGNICQWFIDRNVFISASHICSSQNVTADFLSRNFSDSTEWMLKREIFDRICKQFFLPDVDLFSSHYLNRQLDKFVTWYPKPGSFKVNAFSFSWTDYCPYTFPPFNLTSKFHGEFMSPALFLFEVLKMVKLTRGPLVLYQLPKY